MMLGVLGAGPYAYNRIKGKGKVGVLMFPIAMIIGIGLSFKELFWFIIGPLINRFRSTVKRYWKTIFIDSLH